MWAIFVFTNPMKLIFLSPGKPAWLLIKVKGGGMSLSSSTESTFTSHKGMRAVLLIVNVHLCSQYLSQKLEMGDFVNKNV